MLSLKTKENMLERGYSRRQVSKIAMGAAAAIPFFSEFSFAQQGQRGNLAAGLGGARGGCRFRSGCGPHHLQ